MRAPADSSEASVPAGAPREVPDFRIDFERERRTRHAVCVFMINEGEKIRKQLRAMRERADGLDIVVADGGSTDGSLTPELMSEVDAKVLLVKTGGGKLSAQMRMAMAYCLNQGYEGLVCIDGNGKDGLDGLPAMRAALEEGWDHVQGSRFIPGGHHENTPALRYIAVRLLHAPLISLAAGTRYTDTTNGFRAYSRRLLEDARIAPLRAIFDQYQLHYHLAIEAARLGFRVKEVPVSRCYPASGKTPTKIKGFGGLWRVFRQLTDVCRGKYRVRPHPPPGRGLNDDV